MIAGVSCGWCVRGFAFSAVGSAVKFARTLGETPNTIPACQFGFCVLHAGVSRYPSSFNLF